MGPTAVLTSDLPIVAPPGAGTEPSCETCSEWLAEPRAPNATEVDVPLAAGDRLGVYELLAPLGSGGMGSVWRARDERLGREVALKVLSAEWARDPGGLARFRREALLLAAVTHPNICQVYDLDEHEGNPYLAMELLAGESLAARLSRGSLPPREAVAIASGILAALGELHARGIVHRDLKPSNVFLTPHGVKLLDFGLARRAAEDARDPTISRSGSLYGTPRYMAPEQWTGAAEPASDLFACGAILYEMLSGKPALEGTNAAELLRAASRGGPRGLTGGQGVEALDRVVRRAMAARPRDRFQSAPEMTAAVVAAHPATSETVRLDAPRLTRLLVLPFRLLRPDADIEFLSVGLADAVTASLAGRPDLVVHSSRVAAGFEDENPARIAAEAGVDAVLCGTLLRSGDRVRVSTQLIATPGGSVLSSTTAEASLANLFQLQDDLVRAVASALHVSLARTDGDQEAEERRRREPKPEAYEAYLRGTGTAMNTVSTTALHGARDHFRRAVELDPSFAPAWARLGRVHRVLAKYGLGEPVENRRLARQAFDTALALDPDLPLAHNLYTYFEIEDLQNPVAAMLRLLGRIERCPADPDLFAGLVSACRFTGLFDASLAAHRRAVGLDPEARTSVEYTYWMMGEFAKAAEHDRDAIRFLAFSALPMLGRSEEALSTWDAWRARIEGGLEVPLGEALVGALRGDRQACRAAAARMRDSGFRDAEGLFFVARALAKVGEHEEALELLEWVVGAGFTCPRTLARDPWLEGIRGEPRWAALAERAADGHRHASQVFARADGPRLLGLEEVPTVTVERRPGTAEG